MAYKIDISKSIPQDTWTEFFDQFSDGNRGRHLAIEILDSELGDEQLIQDAPLMAIVNNRPGKGNDLVIETGRDQVNYGHTIETPTEVAIAQDANGKVMAMKIVDAAGTQTVLTFNA